MAFKTPGVYVEEISLFPPSVAEVATAIPAFIGYTEKAERKGEDLTNVPTRIRSLLEYRELFGGAPEMPPVDVVLDEDNNFAVSSVSVADDANRYYMYESLRLFFDNGGGACYVVSAGRFGDAVQNEDGAKGLLVGLDAVEKYDEPTILLFPDAPLLESEGEFYSLQQRALSQCAKLQDRVALFDLRELSPDRAEWQEAVDDFRDNIGINNLKYGMAYTPWLYSAYPRTVDFAIFNDNVTDSANADLSLSSLTSDSNLNGLVSAAETALGDRASVQDAFDSLLGTSKTLRDRYKTLKDGVQTSKSDGDNETEFQKVLGLVRKVVETISGWTHLAGGNLKKDLATYAASALKPSAEKLIALEKNANVLALSDLDDAAAVDDAYASLDAAGWVDVGAIGPSTATYPGANSFARAQGVFKDLDGIFQETASANLLSFIGQLNDAARTHAEMAQTTLYQGHSIIGNVVEHIKREFSRVPPSGAVAGIYAFVDATRGVWKAPANVSLGSVLAPTQPIDFFDQEDLNVDVTSGKSINAIRTFTGRGTVVWGARTLAGNDNEWRYVPVRRFFNMVEESVKKSTNFAVFEPNAAPLWTKVKSMIDNYLVQKWRDGALAGATPDEAFFVKVGLGQTMTAQDILEGRLIVEIGMAVVRPAEFIILKFSHKMQES
jgi:phage tail sheath protein FI